MAPAKISSSVVIFYGFSRTVPIAIALVMLNGFINAPYGIARRLLVQRNTPREVRGRVNSALFVTRDVIMLIGLAAAGLADVIDVRIMIIASSVFLFIPATMAALMPGIGQPAAEWRRSIQLLRGARVAPGLEMGRAATLADFDLLATHLPVLAGLTPEDRQSLVSQTLVSRAPEGTVILRKGEVSDAAYFVMDGRVVAGIETEGGYRILETLNPGDFFGEIAAITGSARTANVVAENLTTVLQVPAKVLREMMANPQLNRLFLSKMTERMVRMDMLDLPRYSSYDQATLRELRTPSPEQAELSAPSPVGSPAG